MSYILYLSFIPVFIIAVYIYKRDVFKKEPIKELFKAFCCGMAIAGVVLAIGFLLDAAGIDIQTNVVLRAFVSAALIEEGTKFFFLYKFFWKNNCFDERFDGIVYAVFVSLGFAFVENVLYISSDVSHAESVAYARAFFAVPAHSLFAVAMGYGMGMAKFSNNRADAYIVRGLLSAIFIHGTYDFLLMYAEELASINESFSTFITMMFYLFVLCMWIVGLRRINSLLEADQWRL